VLTLEYFGSLAGAVKDSQPEDVLATVNARQTDADDTAEFITGAGERPGIRE
jgi:hypothetical protein